MKKLMIIAMLSLSGLSFAQVGEVPEDGNCGCETGKCPGYDTVKCGLIKANSQIGKDFETPKPRMNGNNKSKAVKQ